MTEALGALAIGCVTGVVLAFTVFETTPLSEAEVARAEAWRECNLITSDIGSALSDLGEAVASIR